MEAADGSAAAPVVLFEYPAAVCGRLVRRYKRFLADVVFDDTPPAPTAAAATAAIAATAAAAAAITAAAAGAAATADTKPGPARRGPRRAARPAAAAAAALDTEEAAVAASGEAAGGGIEGGGGGGGGEGAAGGGTTCHCPNTGPMTGLLDWTLAPVVCSVSGAKGRKYAHTLEMIQSAPGGAWVGVHSAAANRLVEALLRQAVEPPAAAAAAAAAAPGAAAGVAAGVAAGAAAGGSGRRPLLPPELLGGEWSEVQREVAYGANGSRVDFVLTRPNGRRVYVEVKSVTLAEPYSPSSPAAATAVATAATAAATATAAAAGAAATAAAAATPAEGSAAVGVGSAAAALAQGNIALFPDTVSARAQRHMRDLVEVVQAGHEAVCVFAIQRGDCARFAPCAAKDPEYARLVRQAAAAGVRMLALRMKLQPPGTDAEAAEAEAGLEGGAGAGAAGSGSLSGATGGSSGGRPARILYIGPAEVVLDYGVVEADVSEGGDGKGGKAAGGGRRAAKRGAGAGRGGREKKEASVKSEGDERKRVRRRGI